MPPGDLGGGRPGNAGEGRDLRAQRQIGRSADETFDGVANHAGGFWVVGGRSGIAP